MTVAPHRIRRWTPTIGLVAAFALLAGCAGEEHETSSTTTTPREQTTFEPLMAPNPHLGPAGTATSHGDSGSSDATPLAGPGTGPVDVELVDVGAVCPSILIGGDGLPVALCTRTRDVEPVVMLLDPASGDQLASMEIAAGSLFGGVYGYLDDADRMVLVDGNDDLLRVGHLRDDRGWTLQVDQRVSLADALPTDEKVTSVTPGYDGAVWFATDGGTIGAVDTDDGSVSTTSLPRGERVANNISSAPAGTAVASDHAVYLFDLDGQGRPVQRWRYIYDRGPARKPGQLSWGTGSTPTFFGPTDGADYVAVVDNADPQVHLVVIQVAGDRAGHEICESVALSEGGPGSENSPIGAGRSVIVASTYGYPYPRLPDDAGPSQPRTAPFEGGMTRIDVRADGTGCDVVWDTNVASVAVPKLSTADEAVLTITRPADSEQATSASAPVRYASTVISAVDGEVLASTELPDDATDPLQLAGTLGRNRVLYQGTLGSILRITPHTGG